MKYKLIFYIKYIFLFIIFFYYSGSTVFTQNQNNDRGKVKHQNVAAELFSKGKYFEAIVYYENELTDHKIKNELQLYYNLAECYRMSRQYEKSEKYYQIGFNKNPLKYPLSLYWVGKMQKAQEKYKEAYTSFKGYYINEKVDKLFLFEAKKEIDFYDSAFKNIFIDSTIVIEPIGPKINNEYNTNRGLLKNDTIWCVATIKQNTGNNISVGDVKGKYKDFFVSRLMYSYKPNSSGWQDIKEADIPLENNTKNIMAPFFDPLFNKLFLTICDEKNNTEHCQIYQSSYTNGNFEKPVKLQSPVNFDNSSSKDPMPVMINKTEYLFFVSDRDNTNGYDIYYCPIDKNGNATIIKNIGSEINTKYDEHSPFYDPYLGMLYFSSRGHNTVGEYDIFSVKGSPLSQWEDVKNLGFPINSGADDYYYFHYTLGDKKYYSLISSNRPIRNTDSYGTICDNILQYEFSTKKPIVLKCILLDDITKEQINQDTVKLINNTTDILMSVQYSLQANTVFFTLEKDSTYNLEIVRNEYYSSIVKVLSSDNDSIVQEVYLKKIPKLEPITKAVKEVTKKTNLTHLQKPVIYFSFNKSDINLSEEQKLNKLADEMIKRPELVIYVESFTDNVDTKNFNITLSQKRTASVIMYLVDKGVDLERLIGQWYGLEKPVAPNETMEGRALNRRTEFAIIKDMTNIRRGQMVNGDKEFVNTSDIKKEWGTDINEDEFELFLNKYGNTKKTALYFRVQVGAFKDPKSFDNTKVNLLTYLQNINNIQLFVEADGEYRKYVTKRFETLNDVNKIKLQIRKTGAKSAFIVTYYKGNRIKISELPTILP